MAGAHKVVSSDKWLAARKKLLVKEKAFTRLADKLSKERRALPWEAVTKEYAFEGPNGKETLAQLFDGRSQLVVYHFMFGPDFNFDFHVSFTPEEMAKKKAFYNFKMQNPDAPEREGVSVFTRDAKGGIFRTYSTFARGIELLNLDYKYLDIVPKAATKADADRTGCGDTMSTRASLLRGRICRCQTTVARLLDGARGAAEVLHFHMYFVVTLVDELAVPYPCASVRCPWTRSC